MKIIFSLLFLILSASASELKLLHNYEKAVEIAKKENKDIYLLIVSETCRWCRKFESTTLQDDPTITRLNSEYVIVTLNRDKDKLPNKFEAQRVPKHYFLTQNEEIIYAFLGCWNPEDFSSFLGDVAKKRKLMRNGK